ncbi:MAG TPA: HAD family hydrolase [Gemmataceae bacterium]|nr:HAD family hydrolase [Gemmataceae bacterium]
MDQGFPQSAAEPKGRLPVRGMIFDLDGTLIVQTLDFEAIRREIGLVSGTPLLEALDAMTGPKLARAQEVLLRHEQAAALGAGLNPGVREFLRWLEESDIRRGLLSRNSRASIKMVLERCGLHFESIVAREDAPYKPSPQGVWQICQSWRLSPAEVVMIGDYLYDIQAGKSAGARTILVTHGRTLPFADQADLLLSGFEEIPDLLRHWIAGADGNPRV